MSLSWRASPFVRGAATSRGSTAGTVEVLVVAARARQPARLSAGWTRTCATIQTRHGTRLWRRAPGSAGERREAYEWLFRTRRKSAQDRAIRIMIEVETFAVLERQWKRLGYPFGGLVPSYATAIGSSADRPDALARLVGIILNDGIDLPTARLTSLELGVGTPLWSRTSAAPYSR